MSAAPSYSPERRTDPRDVPSRIPRSGSDLPLLFFALAIALMIKYAVHEEQQLSERIVDAQVSYTTPEEGMIAFQQMKSVKLDIRGPANDLSRLSPFTVEVLARIPQGRPGAREIVLREEDVRFNVPGDFEVLTIEPNRFSIQVEERLEAVVPLRIRLTGEPAAGARHLDPKVTPDEARLAGPRSRLETISEIELGVSLDGHATTFEEIVSVTSPDPLVQVVSPTLANVLIPMEEPELSITFDDLQVDSTDPDAPTASAGGSP